MRNSLRILHVIQFRCLVKLFFFFIVIIIFVATFMVNKDEYMMTWSLKGYSCFNVVDVLKQIN